MATIDIIDDERLGNTHQNKVFARKHCEEGNKLHAENFDDKLKAEASDFHQWVSETFFRSRCYLNFRSKFITVKVDKVKIQDKVNPAYLEVIRHANEQNYRVKLNRGSLIFEIKPNVKTKKTKKSV